MDWRRAWGEALERPPADPTSREVSVQEVLAELIAGRKCDWFLPYRPTAAGRAFLLALWRALFGNEHGQPEWFVSEYELPVPLGWRQEIPFTYRCPDFACGDEDHVLIIELKTERRSYRGQQMADYLRLARHKLPRRRIDVAILGPHLPGGFPAHDDGQRYAEITWEVVPELLREAFPSDQLAGQLAAFIRADLASAKGVPVRPESVAPPTTTLPAEVSTPLGAGEGEPIADECVAAVRHALKTAPAVAIARPGDRTERGLDVAFQSLAAARAAQAQVKDALNAAGFADLVGVWLWQPGSTGVPTTVAGHEAGRELRLHPKAGAKS